MTDSLMARLARIENYLEAIMGSLGLDPARRSLNPKALVDNVTERSALYQELRKRQAASMYEPYDKAALVTRAIHEWKQKALPVSLMGGEKKRKPGRPRGSKASKGRK